MIVSGKITNEASVKSPNLPSRASVESEFESFPVPMQGACCLDVDELGVMVPSHSPPERLIYLLLIFFSGALKAIVHETPVDSDMYVVARMAIAAATISKGLVSLRMIGDSCGVDAICTSMPLGEILNTSCDSCNYY
ncbi:hypothetical protein AVEN_152904-1 [Araneus ventricosus]|uniref:Uncharacterized protein n=1 Tax=Araneus ventricosus TaxID=182803 RepID=A0A4Y2ADB5_ARAVE|nr:hypothetical protein AVEN_152904-1 [Araneus ventricosus]